MKMTGFFWDKWLIGFILFSVSESSFNIDKDARRAYVVVDDFSILATPHSKISITQLQFLLFDTLFVTHDARSLKWTTTRKHRGMIENSSWFAKQTDLTSGKRARNYWSTRFVILIIYYLYHSYNDMKPVCYNVWACRYTEVCTLESILYTLCLIKKSYPKRCIIIFSYSLRESLVMILLIG